MSLKVFKYIIFDVLSAGLYTIYKYNYIQLSIGQDMKLLEMLSHMFAMDAKLKALSLKVCKYITYDVLSAVWSVHSSHFMSTNTMIRLLNVIPVL